MYREGRPQVRFPAVKTEFPIPNRAGECSNASRSTEYLHQQVGGRVVTVSHHCVTEFGHRHARFKVFFGDRGIGHEIALLIADSVLH